MSDKYAIGNEGARKLAEENAKHARQPVLDNTNQEMIHDDNELFHEILEMFDDVPINDQVIEKVLIKISPSEKEDSETFTFDYSGSGGGILKLDDSYVS